MQHPKSGFSQVIDCGADYVCDKDAAPRCVVAESRNSAPVAVDPYICDKRKSNPSKFEIDLDIPVVRLVKRQAWNQFRQFCVQAWAQPKLSNPAPINGLRARGITAAQISVRPVRFEFLPRA